MFRSSCVYFGSALFTSEVGRNHPRRSLHLLGKSTNRPKMRWVFQLFEGVQLLIDPNAEGFKEIILNLNHTWRHILQVLGPAFEKIYTGAAKARRMWVSWYCKEFKGYGLHSCKAYSGKPLKSISQLHMGFFSGMTKLKVFNRVISRYSMATLNCEFLR